MPTRDANGIIVLAIVGIVAYMVFRTKAKNGEEDDAQKGRVRGFRVGFGQTPGSLIPKLPGDLAMWDRIDFDYKGPATVLRFYAGLKYKTSQDFDNGDHLMTDQRLLKPSWGMLFRGSVPASPDYVSYFAVPPQPGPASLPIFTVPNPDNTQKGQDGKVKTLDWGRVNTWSWIVDENAVLKDRPLPDNNRDPIFNQEKYLVWEGNGKLTRPLIVSGQDIYNIVRNVPQSRNYLIAFGAHR